MAPRHHSSTSSSQRPDMQLHSTSTSTSTSTSPPLSPTLSSSSPTQYQSQSPSSRHQSSFNFFSGRAISRSTTIDTFFHPRSRSKSPQPSPPTDITTNMSSQSRHTQPSPHSSSPSSSSPIPASPRTQQQRHKSDGAIPSLSSASATSSPTSPTQGDIRRDTFFQKKPKHRGSLSHYGRHGNDWLFGNVSFTQTARGLVQRGSSGSSKDR